ncbi:killer cell lectin-like receptor subfamily F member 1 [Mauremys reevesii]|uniref:killer cell lectin-like receptor subfamily F member 1 n=1 Tax=Mauremys reevesii TaxID=260615 RepID=UPI00193ECE00|nr:killer cell lectin-like receptor subfamily F member 1 [Mauremys reevesii]
MEDEEGYTVLNLRPKQRQPGRPPGAGPQGSPRYPRWIWVALGLAGAGCLVLLGAVVALAVWISQLPISCEGETRGATNASEIDGARIISSTECSFCLEDFRSRLKSILYEPHNGSLAEGSGCQLCPRDWLLHGDKCYWLPKECKNWTGSRDDCSGKRAQMLVIQNREEMDFIQDVIQGASYIWIGLKVTPPGGKWTWVDGSPLDPMLAALSFDDPAAIQKRNDKVINRIQTQPVASGVCLR